MVYFPVRCPKVVVDLERNPGREIGRERWSKSNDLNCFNPR